MLKKIVYGIGIGLMACQFVAASVVSTSVDDFTLLAGGTLTTGADVTVGGNAGSAGALYLGQNTSLNGNGYTVNTFGVNKNVSMTGDVISTGDISIGQQSSTGSLNSLGNVGLENKAIVSGNIASGGRVSINSSAKVSGNVSYSTGYWADKSATLSGTTGQNISDISTWSYTGRSTPSNWTTGSQYLYYSPNSSVSLSPGDYSGMSVSDGSTIYLTAGTYNLADVWLGKDVSLIADTSKGDVILNMAGSLSTSSGATITEDDANSLILNTQGSISLGSDNTVAANLYAYGSSMTIEKGSIVTGRLYSAGSLYLGNNVSVSGPVPEPVSIVLMATGILFMAGRRRMKIRLFHKQLSVK
jgi:predicted acyltransferase (DUF342 family)